MKLRSGFVSNSSSSSFLMPMDVSDIGVECIKLSDEVIECFKQYLTDFDGKNVDLSASKEWWLTRMVSDCEDHYSDLRKKGGIEYLAGNEYPYGWYEDDGPKRYVRLGGKNGHNEFFIAVGDLVGRMQQGQMPKGIEIKFFIEKILHSKAMNKTQKLLAIENYFETM